MKESKIRVESELRLLGSDLVASEVNNGDEGVVAIPGGEDGDNDDRHSLAGELQVIRSSSTSTVISSNWLKEVLLPSGGTN